MDAGPCEMKTSGRTGRILGVGETRTGRCFTHETKMSRNVGPDGYRGREDIQIS